jgi:TatA/E family protein of Tat protein translocase
MDFFGISFVELVVLAILAFILFGPEKLPEYAQKAGRLVARLRQATSEMSEQYRTPFQEARESFRSAAFPKVPPIPPPPEEFFQETACPQCRHRVDKSFHYCPSCGHNLKEPEESPYFHGWEFPCPQCGRQVTGDYAFCPDCGRDLAEAHRDRRKTRG